MTIIATSADLDSCTAEVKTFVLAGRPGIERLQQVIDSIFEEYNITSYADRNTVMQRCELKYRTVIEDTPKGGQKRRMIISNKCDPSCDDPILG